MQNMKICLATRYVVIVHTTIGALADGIDVKRDVIQRMLGHRHDDALDVRGSVNVNGATPFLTNGVAVGTIIYGTWLGPTFATLTHQALWSISLSPGTWVITGGINVTSNSQGIVYFGIGTSNTTVNQGNRVNGPTGNLELALQSTLFVSITSTTTYYGVGYSTATGNWDKEAYTIFQAMKIC